MLLREQQLKTTFYTGVRTTLFFAVALICAIGCVKVEESEQADDEDISAVISGQNPVVQGTATQEAKSTDENDDSIDDNIETQAVSADCVFDESFSPPDPPSENTYFFGCMVLDENRVRYDGAADSGYVNLVRGDATEEKVDLIVEDLPENSVYHAYLPILAATVPDISSMEAFVIFGDTQVRFTVEVEFNTHVSVLTFSEGADYDFASQAIRSLTEYTFTVFRTGDFDAKIGSSAGLDANLSYKGGTYPGEGGTCGSSITAPSCTLILVFQPTDNKAYGFNFELDYFNGVADQTLDIAITGTGELIATQVQGHSLFNEGDANDGGATAADVLSSPYGAHVAGGKLFVADKDNHRVLIWNSLPTSHQTAADIVLGQPNMTANTPNNGGIAATTLNGPRAVYSDGTNLFVADTGNNRVLIWDAIPTVDQTAADRVLGQADMSSSSMIFKNQNLWTPTSVWADAGHVFVADSFNHRVLIWNSNLPASSAWADTVVGQANMTSGSINGGGGPGSPSATVLYTPEWVYSDGTKLYVADKLNHRVLIYNSIAALPAADGTADVVLGQPDFDTNTAPATASAINLENPTGLISDGTRLFVSDMAQNRILIWDSVPTTNQTAADHVFGQVDFTASGGNGGSGTATNQGISQPAGLVHHLNTLYISDTNNHRLIGLPVPALP